MVSISSVGGLLAVNRIKILVVLSLIAVCAFPPPPNVLKRSH